MGPPTGPYYFLAPRPVPTYILLGVVVDENVAGKDVDLYVEARVDALACIP
jgi:hypothetical protein